MWCRKESVFFFFFVRVYRGGRWRREGEGKGASHVGSMEARASCGRRKIEKRKKKKQKKIGGVNGGERATEGGHVMDLFEERVHVGDSGP